MTLQSNSGCCRLFKLQFGNLTSWYKPAVSKGKKVNLLSCLYIKPMFYFSSLRDKKWALLFQIKCNSPSQNWQWAFWFTVEEELDNINMFKSYALYYEPSWHPRNKTIFFHWFSLAWANFPTLSFLFILFSLLYFGINNKRELNRWRPVNI